MTKLNEAEKTKKEAKETKNKEAVKKDKKKETKKEKKGLLKKIKTYFKGVKTEISRIRWTKGKDLLKYSITTVVFIVFFGLFFYVIDLLVALLRSSL